MAVRSIGCWGHGRGKGHAWGADLRDEVGQASGVIVKRHNGLEGSRWRLRGDGVVLDCSGSLIIHCVQVAGDDWYCQVREGESCVNGTKESTTSAKMLEKSLIYSIVC